MTRAQMPEFTTPLLGGEADRLVSCCIANGVQTLRSLIVLFRVGF